MRLVGLDQALRKSGAALLDGDRFVVAVAFDNKAPRQGKAFMDFRNWWREFLQRNRPINRVALEEPLRSDMQRTEVEFDGQAEAFGRSVVRRKVPITNMNTLLGLYGIRAHAIEICEELRIPYVEVNVQDWRQVIHGRRSAPKGTSNSSEWWKAQALDRCRLLKWNVPSKDAAEAALIAEWLRISLSPLGARHNDLFSDRRVA